MSTAAVYAEHAFRYRTAGWTHTLPLPRGRKFPPPTGYTGYSRVAPSGPDIAEWADATPDGNLALGMERGIAIGPYVCDLVALDVDDYAKGDSVKTGAATVADLERRAGVAFPPTWKTTSRGEGPSGKYLYLVPAGTTLITELVGIELIQWFHRYAVAPPSTNPHSGNTVFEWRTGARPVPAADGEATDTVPHPSDAAVLPAALLNLLSRAATHVDSTDVDREARRAFFAAMPPGPPCTAVRNRLAAALHDLRGAGIARHAATRDHVLTLMRLGHQNHLGAGAALDELRDAYIHAVRDRAEEAEARGEFRRFTRGKAVGAITDQPTPEDERVCLCPENHADLLDSIDDPELRAQAALVLGVQ